MFGSKTQLSPAEAKAEVVRLFDLERDLTEKRRKKVAGIADVQNGAAQSVLAGESVEASAAKVLRAREEVRTVEAAILIARESRVAAVQALYKAEADSLRAPRRKQSGGKPPTSSGKLRPCWRSYRRWNSPKVPRTIIRSSAANLLGLGPVFWSPVPEPWPRRRRGSTTRRKSWSAARFHCRIGVRSRGRVSMICFRTKRLPLPSISRRLCFKSRRGRKQWRAKFSMTGRIWSESLRGRLRGVHGGGPGVMTAKESSRIRAENNVVMLLAGSLAARRSLQGSEPGWRRLRAQEELVCFHEAGHVLVFHLNGEHVYEATAIPNSLKKTLGYCRGGESPEPPEFDDTKPGPTDIQSAAGLCLALSLLESNWRESNWRSAIQIYHRLRQRAASLVEEHWPAVCLLAGELMFHKRLDQRQLTAILSRM